MTNRRAKAFATATVFGLGGLGAVALGSNPGLPTAAQQGGASGATASVTTGASGAAALASSQTVAVKSSRSGAPIVTRASGGGQVPRDD